MSVFKKLQDARIELQGKVLKKSGLNKFAGFQYFELGDFLPEVQALFHKHGLSSTINFHAADAVLMIVDVDDNSSAIFSCPVVIPTMKGCNEVQALGAMITYIRRYLYVNALEIVEHDAMDAVVGKDDKQSGKPTQNPDFKPDADEIEHLNNVVRMVFQCGIDYAYAASYLSEQHLDADEKTWVWDKLDSKTRSGIKKANAQLKENI